VYKRQGFNNVCIEHIEDLNAIYYEIGFLDKYTFKHNFEYKYDSIFNIVVDFSFNINFYCEIILELNSELKEAIDNGQYSTLELHKIIDHNKMIITNFNKLNPIDFKKNKAGITLIFKFKKNIDPIDTDKILKDTKIKYIGCHKIN